MDIKKESGFYVGICEHCKSFDRHLFVDQPSLNNYVFSCRNCNSYLDIVEFMTMNDEGEYKVDVDAEVAFYEALEELEHYEDKVNYCHKCNKTTIHIEDLVGKSEDLATIVHVCEECGTLNSEI